MSLIFWSYFRRFCNGDRVSIFLLMFIGCNIKFFLNIFFEVSISTPDVLLIQDLSFLFTAENVFKITNQDVCYGDCFACIDEISH